jgi:hypothetical protein
MTWIYTTHMVVEVLHDSCTGCACAAAAALAQQSMPAALHKVQQALLAGACNQHAHHLFPASPTSYSSFLCYILA